ncbi:MAG: threonylcarbamoyl-AMP synthase [Bacteroidia bacterium]|nr:MAG: threonylcarbamoyl-AMP synthase [Bacteroidia bacterium]
MLIKINSEKPQEKEVESVVKLLRDGGVIIYPTDTVYALGCDIYQTKAIERIARLKKIDPEKALFTFICSDISDISNYVLPIPNSIFKVIKKLIPGPYTFILNANSNVPKILKQNRKTIGIRVADNNITREIIKQLGHPILSSSLIDAEDDIKEYYTDPQEIYEQYKNKVDLIIDGGYGNVVPSTILDCTKEEIEVIREGAGKVEW